VDEGTLERATSEVKRSEPKYQVSIRQIALDTHWPIRKQQQTDYFT
jgi:hypothetical protein